MTRKQKLTAAAYFAALEGVGAAVTAATMFDADALGIAAGFAVGAALLGAASYALLSLITKSQCA